MFEFNRGQCLPNGAIIILADVGEETAYVLAMRDSDFVTWQSDLEGNTYWGHYFHIPNYDTEEDALRYAIDDFVDRVAKRRSAA